MKDFIAKMQRDQEVKTQFTNTVGSTRLPPSRRAKAPLRRDGSRRVQFPDASGPNCRGRRTIDINRMNNGKLCSQKVSGATPETTRETRVLPHIFPRLCVIK
jgi:hypothetical protein